MAVIGWIKPDDNVRSDHDCYNIEKWLHARGADGVRAIVRTSRSSGLHQEDALFEIGGVERLIPPARELAAAGADVVAWACTSGSFIGGLAWSEAQRDELAAAVGRTATSTSLAIVAAIRHIGASKVDLLSPYPSDVTAALIEFLRQAGSEVGFSVSLESPSGPVSFGIDIVAATMRLPASDRAVVIPDTAVNSLDLLVALEERLSRPVITAVQATLWHSMRLAGVPVRIPRAGYLFGIA